MSGGSYNYLYIKSLGEMIGARDDIHRAIGRILHLGYADDVVVDLRKLLHFLEACEKEHLELMGKLEGVLRALEWWDSGDTSEDGFKESLEKYREAKK